MGNLQIKNVPPELHAAVAARAKSLNMTMSAYILGVIERGLAEPPMTAWLRGLRDAQADMTPLPTNIGAQAVADARRENRYDDEHLDVAGA